MPFTIRKVDYFYATVRDEPGEAYKLLALFAESGVNLAAFTAMPIGPMHAQLTLFPDDSRRLTEAARRANLPLTGPHPALLVQGQDALGALAGVHERLHRAGVNVYASTGVADGRGGYGYIVYLRPEEYEAAARALEL